LTALTRPRISSGVSSCTSDDRTTEPSTLPGHGFTGCVNVSSASDVDSNLRNARVFPESRFRCFASGHDFSVGEGFSQMGKKALDEGHGFSRAVIRCALDGFSR
jgi:hypothetical protein